jgi:hypothetical protein
VGDGPPEAERLAEVEELGRDQDPEQDGRTDTVGLQQPPEVSDRARDADHDQ